LAGGEGGDRAFRVRAPAESRCARCLRRARRLPIVPRFADRRDKEQVTVGGIIVEAKRIKTERRPHDVPATLDDLNGAVEMLVFGKALVEHEAALAVDKVVLVRGRVDHKEAGKTCLVVQTVEAFSPSAEEIARARTRADVAAKTPPRWLIQCACASMRPACRRARSTIASR